jgi:hypothetical protein
VLGFEVEENPVPLPLPVGTSTSDSNPNPPSGQGLPLPVVLLLLLPLSLTRRSLFLSGIPGGLFMGMGLLQWFFFLFNRCSLMGMGMGFWFNRVSYLVFII